MGCAISDGVRRCQFSMMSSESEIKPKDPRQICSNDLQSKSLLPVHIQDQMPQQNLGFLSSRLCRCCSDIFGHAVKDLSVATIRMSKHKTIASAGRLYGPSSGSLSQDLLNKAEYGTSLDTDLHRQDSCFVQRIEAIY